MIILTSHESPIATLHVVSVSDLMLVLVSITVLFSTSMIQADVSDFKITEWPPAAHTVK